MLLSKDISHSPEVDINPSSFALAVITNDISAIVKIPGIGKKTAERMILELKDKLKTEQAITKDNKIEQAIIEDNKDSEAISALQVLGYTRKEIEKALEKIELQNLSVEEIIRKALGILGNN